MDNFNEKLAEEVKKYPFLYNKREREYKNVIKKTRTWHEIGQKFNLTDEECTRKWKSLRDRFTKELKKQSELRASGSESQQLETSNWELFQSLMFLKDYCEPNKRTTTNYEVKVDVSTSSSSFTEEEERPQPTNAGSSSSTGRGTNTVTLQPTPTGSNKAVKRKQLEDVNASFMEAASSFKKMCNEFNKQPNNPSEDQQFGETVVAFITALNDPEERKSAKESVLKFLAEQVAAQFS